MPEQSEVSSQFKPHVAAQLVPVLLTEDYYSLWKSFLVPVLKNYDMFNMVQGIEQPLTEDKDRKCMSFINLTLSESMLPYAAEACSSSRALWLKLEEEGRIAKIRLVQLSSRLGKLKKGKFTSMSKYYQMKKTMADRLKAAGSPVSDREFTKHVLNGLPYEYGAFSKPIIGALIAGTDELTPEELHDLLVNEESRRREYQKEEYSRREQRCPREQRRNTAINYGRFFLVGSVVGFIIGYANGWKNALIAWPFTEV